MSDTVRLSSTFHADIVKHSQAIVYTECRQFQIYSGRHLHLVLTIVWTVLVLLSRNRLLLKNKFNHVIVRNGYGVLPGFIEYVKCTDMLNVPCSGFTSMTGFLFSSMEMISLVRVRVTLFHLSYSRGCMLLTFNSLPDDCILYNKKYL